MKKTLLLATVFCSGLSLITTAQKIPTTSFGKGIQFMAQDSSMSMKMTYRMQQLFEVTRDGNSNTTETEAQLRRSRLKFEGYAFSPKLEYKVELGLSSADISTNREDGRTGGSSRLVLDAVMKYEFVNNWDIWVGQTKLPGNRERVVSSSEMQFVDRSLINSRFNIDRDMGVQIHGNVKLGGMIVKPKAAFTMGEGRSVSEANLGGFNYTGRVDFLPLGNFEGKKADYIVTDFERQSKPKVSIGLTYNLNDRAVRQQGQLGAYVKDAAGDYVENTLQHFEADMLFKYKGFSSMAEWAYTTGDATTKGFNTGQGFTAAAGYLFKNNYEIAARFAGISAIDGVASRLKAEDQYTIGVSKYIVGHNLKIQSDFTVQDLPNSELNYIYRLQFELQL